MEFLFDTANLEAIKTYGAIYPITGITSNPSILKKEGKVDFFNHFREIRKVIGIEKTLHIQVIGRDAETMVREGRALLDNIDDKVFIKIPTTAEGLKAMRILKSEGAGMTATAIYSKIQGYLAMEAGADYIAPYVNRMENLDIDAVATISAFANQIVMSGYQTKILAASFKNIAQVNAAFEAGAQTATVAPELLHEALGTAAIQKAVDDFENDWEAVYGKLDITEL